jgi:hypothetical protein
MQEPSGTFAEQIRFRPAECHRPRGIDAEVFALEIGYDQQVLRDVPEQRRFSLALFHGSRRSAGRQLYATGSRLPHGPLARAPLPRIP